MSKNKSRYEFEMSDDQAARMHCLEMARIDTPRPHFHRPYGSAPRRYSEFSPTGERASNDSSSEDTSSILSTAVAYYEFITARLP